MLTGRPVFSGDRVARARGGVEGRAGLDDAAGEHTRGDSRLLRRCLEKDRKRRFDSAADAQLEIDDALATQPADVSLTVPRRRERLAWATTVAATAVALGISLLVITGPASQPGPVIRFPVSPPSVPL
jgi:hypothetical protein